MRARLVRQAIILAGMAAVLVGWLARPRAQSAGPAPLVFAPGAEVAGAADRGKADTATAQKLARKKKFAEAVALLEKVAVEHPSVVHDCNLALAYLRAGQLTRAQLVWDVSRLRGAQPPDWCDASLSGQLASALRTKGYVPLTLNVQPTGALVEVGGVSFREMGLVWLPTATYQVQVSFGGWVTERRPIVVAPPSANASVLLVEMGDPTMERDAAPAPVDAGVEPTTTDAAVASTVDAAIDLDIDPPSVPTQPERATWPGYAGVGAAGLGLGLGVAFHVRALGSKDRANMLPTDSVGFRDARDRFGNERALAIGGYVVSAAAIGFTAWWWLGKDQGEPPLHRSRDRRKGLSETGARTVGVDVGGGHAVLTFGGTLP